MLFVCVGFDVQGQVTADSRACPCLLLRATIFGLVSRSLQNIVLNICDFVPFV